jgi:hypothetical protein
MPTLIKMKKMFDESNRFATFALTTLNGLKHGKNLY